MKSKVAEHSGRSWYVEHLEARETIELKPCEVCGSTRNIDIHHKDGNWHNNDPGNLQCLCRSCHLRAHKKKGVCKICGKPVKGHGYCNKHYIRYKKYGDPMFRKYNTRGVEL